MKPILKSTRSRLLAGTVLPLAVVAALASASPAFAACQGCNPCAAKAACTAANPCAAKAGCNPCNPCAAKAKATCSPCQPASPCKPSD